ncbi:MAG: hypothetical protein ABI867_23270 [Kofleriaceae bacterium]
MSWLERWPALSPTVFDGVSDAAVEVSQIVEVAWHDAYYEGGEVVEQVAVVRLADGRWASLVYSQYSKTAPVALYAVVAATRERIWWFGLHDEHRERLTARLTSEQCDEELVQIDELLESHDPAVRALGERRMLQRSTRR